MSVCHGSLPARPARGAPRGRHACFHLAALLSTRGERDPELAHQVNVEGTLNVLRMAQNQSVAPRAAGARSSFRARSPSTGCPSPEEKRAIGQRARGAVERAHHDVRVQQALLRAPRPLLHVPRAPARRPVGGRPPRLPRAAFPRAHLGGHRARGRHERLRPRDDPRGRARNPLHVLRRARSDHPLHGHARRRRRAARVGPRRPRAADVVRLQHSRVQRQRRADRRARAARVSRGTHPVRAGSRARSDRRLVAARSSTTGAPASTGAGSPPTTGTARSTSICCRASRRGTRSTSLVRGSADAPLEHPNPRGGLPVGPTGLRR